MPLCKRVIHHAIINLALRISISTSIMGNSLSSYARIIQRWWTQLRWHLPFCRFIIKTWHFALELLVLSHHLIIWMFWNSGFSYSLKTLYLTSNTSENKFAGNGNGNGNGNGKRLKSAWSSIGETITVFACVSCCKTLTHLNANVPYCSWYLFLNALTSLIVALNFARVLWNWVGTILL